MRFLAFAVLIYLEYGFCVLWPKGVVHYAINKKDYDVHSQDEIMSTMAGIQKEICVKFFNTPMNFSASSEDKILYISNPDKRKNCPPEQYDFSGSVVDMPIGYKCVNEKEITRIVVDMLRASIENTVSTINKINSYDLIRKFQEYDVDPSRPTLLSPSDQNYINAQYHTECGELSLRPAAETRRFSGGTTQMSEENEMYYRDKLWPLGVVMYGIEDKLRQTPEHTLLVYAMTTVELSSCVVFQELLPETVLVPKSLLWFAEHGEDMPHLGFMEGNQTLCLSCVTSGAAGHTAHALHVLLRVLGVPMMSNRYDRDSYVNINWRNVEKGKEQYLERAPAAAWLADREGGKAPYEYESAAHAPANYMCADCSLGTQTVQPIQDHLWQRSLSMGHRTDLSAGDKDTLDILYSKQCQNRFMANH